MADVERGVWRPPEPQLTAETNLDPTFHEFASEWFEGAKGEWREKTRLDYQWQLTNHLLPFFRNHRLEQITVREIDRYRQSKVTEGEAVAAAATEGKPMIEEYVDKRGRTHHRPRRPLSAASINKTITRLSQILEVAVEYGLIEANPAKGRRRRLKATKTPPGVARPGRTDRGATRRRRRTRPIRADQRRPRPEGRTPLTGERCSPRSCSRGRASGN